MNGLTELKQGFFRNLSLVNKNSTPKKDLNIATLPSNPSCDTVSFGKSRHYTDECKLLMRTMRKLSDTLHLPDFYTGKRFGIDSKEKVSIEHLIPHSQRHKAAEKGLKTVNSLENFVPVGSKTNSDRSSIPLRDWYKEHPDFIENGNKALKEYEKVSNPIINGKEWVKSIKKLLNQELGYIAFKGRNNPNNLNLVQNQQVNFGYSSPLKAIIGLDAYTGKALARHQRTFEHILPHSKGGPNTIANCLITGSAINGERGNMNFDKWLKIKPSVIKNIQNYLDKFRGLQVNGQDYVETVKRTLNKEAKGVVTFKGNQPQLQKDRNLSYVA